MDIYQAIRHLIQPQMCHVFVYSCIDPYGRASPFGGIIGIPIIVSLMLLTMDFFGTSHPLFGWIFFFFLVLHSAIGIIISRCLAHFIYKKIWRLRKICISTAEKKII